MLGAVDTIPDGIVKGPLTVFPRNAVFTRLSKFPTHDYKGPRAVEPRKLYKDGLIKCRRTSGERALKARVQQPNSCLGPATRRVLPSLKGRLQIVVVASLGACNRLGNLVVARNDYRVCMLHLVRRF